MNNIYAELWQAARGLVILKVICDLGRPATLSELVAITGGDDETISKYCSLLAKMGLLTRVSAHAGWTLTSAGMAFAWPGLQEIAAGGEGQPAAAWGWPIMAGRAPQALEAAEAAAEAGSRTNASQIPVNSPESALSMSINLTHQDLRRGVESPKTGKSPENLGDQAENWQFFEQIGVTHNVRTEQIAAKLPNQLVRAEWQKLKDLGKPWPGLLVKILAQAVHKHPPDCRCKDCERQQRMRYAAWDTHKT